MTFNEEEDEDRVVEEGPQIQRGTVFVRDTCHREIYQSNIRDKRIPREAFSDLGDVKVENVTVTFHDEEDEDILVEEGSQIERDTLVFLRDTCHREIFQRNIPDQRLPREACFDLGRCRSGERHCDLSMKRRMKTFSWERNHIERGTVFHRNTCHCEIYHRKIRDKRFSS